MTKANEIRPGMLPQQVQNLQQKEAAKAKEQAQQAKVSQTDQARIAQQAGFTRAGAKKKGKGFDVGDSSRSPIPLPDDDVDPDSWAHERLDDAQKSLGLASTQFEEITKTDAPNADLAGSVVGSSFLPTEAGLEELEDLAKRPAPTPIPLDEVTTNVERLFKIKLDDEVSVGHKVLATGLVVAGEASSVDVGGGKLNEKKLAGGIQKVTERSNQAVGEAQKMNKGINRELNVQRTFMFKR